MGCGHGSACHLDIEPCQATVQDRHPRCHQLHDNRTARQCLDMQWCSSNYLEWCGPNCLEYYQQGECAPMAGCCLDKVETTVMARSTCSSGFSSRPTSEHQCQVSSADTSNFCLMTDQTKCKVHCHSFFFLADANQEVQRDRATP